MLLYPLLAMILTAGDLLYEKYIFVVSRLKDRSKIFVPIMFIFSFLFLIIVVAVLPQTFSIAAKGFEPIFLLLMFLVVAIASIRNMLYYYSFQREGLCEIEPFMSFVPLLTILIAGIVYPGETNIRIFSLAIIAALALILSHIKRKHLIFDRALLPILAVIVIEAAENNIVRELLRFYSPAAMYMVRTFFVSLMLLIFIRPNFTKVYKKEYINLACISLLWVAVMIFYYYAYQVAGVVYTSLIMMLAPLLIVVGSRLILKEKKIEKRNIIALLIVLGCVVAAQFVR